MCRLDRKRSDQLLLLILRVCQANNVLLHKGQTLIIEAKFNGESLASDPIPGSIHADVNTELAWSVSRKELHDLRLQKAPIKVELYATSSSQKKLLGYCILDPRTAEVGATDQKWHKMIGSKHADKPVLLLLCLALEIDEETQVVTRVETVEEVTEKRVEKMDVSNKEEEKSREFVNTGFDLKPVLFEGAYFRIGPADRCHDSFCFSVTVVFADNLPLLLPDESSNWPHLDSKYHFYFSLLGCDITTEAFQNITSPEFLAEKASAKIKSSVSFLKRFFEQQKIFEVQFFCDDFAIGYSSVDMAQLSSKIGNEIYLKPVSIAGQYPLRMMNGEIPKNALDQNPVVGLSLTLSIQQDLEREGSVDNKFVQASESGNQSRSEIPLECNAQELEMEVNTHSSLAEERSGMSALPKTNKYLQENPLYISPSQNRQSRLDSEIEQAKNSDYICSFVKELEDWKERQKTKLKDESDKEEMKRFEMLLNQWRQQYTQWQSLFKQKVKKCDEIENNAKTLLQNLMKREEDLKQVEEDFERSKRELAWISDRMHAESDERCEKLKSDFDLKLKLEVEKVKILQNEIKHLTSKESKSPIVVELKEKIAKISADKDLLEEKLTHVRQSKAYYKEQWLRALDKIDNPYCSGEVGDLQQMVKQKDREIEHLKSLLFSNSKKSEDIQTSSSGKNDSPLVRAAIEKGMRVSRAGTDSELTRRKVEPPTPESETRAKGRFSRSKSVEGKRKPLTNSEKTIRPPSISRRSVAKADPLPNRRPLVSRASLEDMQKELEMLERHRLAMLQSGLYKDIDTVIIRTDAKIANLRQSLNSD
ncbi:centrosomal protein of 120 kDa-like isoform X2 [Artemia franciscana]|uniref:centrosomal protein of 120 kDa-like isoform X2 n=1 Tax=Artemia franciscana TaxID=6661 RepID=UPI0032DB6B48